MLATTGSCRLPKLTVCLVLKTMLSHTVLEKSDPDVIMRQTGMQQGSTMQIVNGMVKALIATSKETQVQSLLMVQLLSEVQPARVRRESHMSCLLAHEVSKILTGHEV